MPLVEVAAENLVEDFYRRAWRRRLEAEVALPAERSRQPQAEARAE